MRTLLIISLAFLSIPTFAASEVDAHYAFRHLAIAVVNGTAEPVYGETVENALVAAAGKNSRFEFSDRGYLALKDALKGQTVSLGEKTTGDLGALAPVMKSLGATGVDSAILGEMIAAGDGYRIRLALIETTTPEKIHQIETVVGDSTSLDGFAAAARNALQEVIKGIPFEAAVLSREGYRVVLDRGYPFFHRGQQVAVYTMNRTAEGAMLFEETGVLGIARAEANMSFAKVLVERTPKQIVPGNKIRTANNARLVDGAKAGPMDDRAPASLADGSTSKGAIAGANGRDNLGFIHLDLGASSISWSNSAADGSGSSSRSGMYTGGALLAQLWLTTRLFADLNFAFGSASLAGSGGGAALNSSTQNLGLQFGYRIDLSNGSLGPTMYVKGGLAKRGMRVDTNADPLALTSLSYSGFVVGAGGKIPLNEKYGIGVDLQTLLIGGVSEDPLTSGASTKSVSWWELGLRGYYTIMTNLDLEGTINFLANGADFEGQGTRPTPLSSTSQNGKAFRFGIAYYF